MNLENFIELANTTSNSMVEGFDNKEKSLIKNEIALELCSAFSKGVQSIIEVQSNNVKDSRQASKELQQELSEIYITKNLPFFTKFIINCINDISINGKLNIGWEDSIQEYIERFSKTIYDLAFMNGITVAQDPQKLKLYLKNKERAINDGSRNIN